MPITGTASTWSAAIVAAIGYSEAGLTESEKNAIKNAWLAICGAHITHLTTNALISTTGATSTGTPGGPLPIVAQPGVMT